jgi:HEAT repeat protein
VLGVTSFHRSGHVREAAVRELDRIDDGSELPFLLLRANDWVDNVRSSAKDAIRRRMVSDRFDQFARNIQLVIRLAECGRDKHDEVVQWFIAQLVRSEHESVLHEVIQSPNRWLGRKCFRWATELDGDHRRRLVLVGLRSLDVVLRVQAARQVRLTFPLNELANILPAMEQDRFMPVRREALIARVERQPDQTIDALETALLDRSASMREFARFYLGKRGRSDFANVYRQAILRSPQIGLMGLGETGSAEDVTFALPFLSNATVAIRVAAVRLLSNLGGDRFTEELISALQDESKKVTLAACKGLWGRTADLSPRRLLEIALTNPHQHVQLAAADLLDRTGTWSAIPFLASLSVHSDERLAARSRELIARRINHVFTAPNLDERRRIEAAMDEFSGQLPQSFMHDFEQWLACRT